MANGTGYKVESNTLNVWWNLISMEKRTLIEINTKCKNVWIKLCGCVMGALMLNGIKGINWSLTDVFTCHRANKFIGIGLCGKSWPWKTKIYGTSTLQPKRPSYVRFVGMCAIVGFGYLALVVITLLLCYFCTPTPKWQSKPPSFFCVPPYELQSHFEHFGLNWFRWITMEP